ncbi:hypothetical protein F5Y18DRAFT_161610 [Xylariaceae sp. FL1019]|nr:hypothetical protein F5Y18DRAFT_161610 [Xylariaceae sp. FL1019]
MPLLSPSDMGRVQRDSWPPARVWPSSPSRLPPALDEDRDGLSTDEDDVEPSSTENPLKYFLTPATPREEEEELDFDFELDAGIEDSNGSRQIVRSISPSTLDGLKKYKPRNRNPDCAILDDDEDDEDEEDYIRFSPHKLLPFSLEDYFDRPRQSSAHTTLSQSAEALISPSFHVGSPRGRLVKRFTPPPRRPSFSRGRSVSLQRRHSWREPSPDVWSIEEEPEKETMSEMGLSIEDLDDGQEKKTQPIDIPAAKPRLKRVRFVLPAKE